MASAMKELIIDANYLKYQALENACNIITGQKLLSDLELWIEKHTGTRIFAGLQGDKLTVCYNGPIFAFPCDPSPMHRLADLEHRHEYLFLLLRKGANINLILEHRGTNNSYFTTPLHLAICFGSLENAKLLIANGADVNLQGNGPRGINGTPLHFAIYEERFDLAKLLIDHGADPEIKNLSSKSAMELVRKKELDKSWIDLFKTCKPKTKGQPKTPQSHADVKSLLLDIPKMQNALERSSMIETQIKDLDTNWVENSSSVDSEIASLTKAIRQLEEDKHHKKAKYKFKRKALISDSKFLDKDDRKTMKKRLKEALELREAFVASAKECLTSKMLTAPSQDLECPICVTYPEKTLMFCQECDNFCCSNCAPRFETCPMCRVALDDKPLVPNKAAERLLRHNVVIGCL